MSSLFIVPAGEIAQFDAGTIPNPGEMFLRRGLETCAPTKGNWIETLWMARFHNIQPGEKLQEPAAEETAAKIAARLRGRTPPD